MARFRKEKGGPSRLAGAPKSALLKKLSTVKSTNAILHEQVLALGGTQEDIDLLKNVDDNAIASPSTHDVRLHL